MDNATWVMEEAKLAVTGGIALIAAGISVFVQLGMKRIADRQARTAAAKLNFDLFHERLKVYQAARNFMGCCAFHESISESDFEEFEKGTKGSRWLFDQKFADYLYEVVHTNAVRLQNVEFDVQDAKIPVDRAQIQRRAVDLRNLFREEIPKFEDLANKFMTIME